MKVSVPVIFVRLKSAAVATPETVAVTTYDPAISLARKAEEVAIPLALVVSVSIAMEFEAKVPLASVAGAAKVTVTPLKGFA
jgi:hypothetical protein